MAAIAVENVSKAWGESRGVDRIRFATDAGKFLVLLGPSGCGKSTTLRLIAGLELPDAGRIMIAGDDVTHLPPSRRHLSMVFQSYALFPHLSVAENILFGLKVRKASTDAQRQGLERVAGLLGLSKLLERKPNQLSGGQQQRVALGRAIIAEQPVCLMDEPLSNLDAQLRNDMRREIRALQQKLGMTMVYVTHDQAEAMSMADQVILLREGRIEQDATPDEMYARPASIFVARFIGTPPMNVVAGATLARASTGWADKLGARAETMAIGVRPEDIHLAADWRKRGQARGQARPESVVDADFNAVNPSLAPSLTPSLAPLHVPASIVAIEYLGADSVVTCTLGDETIAVRAKGKLHGVAGDRVDLAWDTAAMHCFDQTTGHRLDERIA